MFLLYSIGHPLLTLTHIDVSYKSWYEFFEEIANMIYDQEVTRERCSD